MKLATSTGDYSFYVNTIAEKVKQFKGSQFKYINLEQTGNIPEFFESSEDGTKKLINDWAEAAEYAGVKYVKKHKQHNAILLLAPHKPGREPHENVEYAPD